MFPKRMIQLFPIIVIANNEAHLTTKKLISKFSPFLIENLMGNSMRPFSGHENNSTKSYSYFSKFRALTFGGVSTWT